MRDEFPRKIAVAIAERAGYRCANPTCHRMTSGPNPANPDAGLNIGVAAHISGASPGGPRYDPSMSAQQRTGADNGIWLCASLPGINGSAGDR